MTREEMRAEDNRRREAARATGETRYWSIRLCKHPDHNVDGLCLRYAGPCSGHSPCIECRRARDRTHKRRTKSSVFNRTYKRTPEYRRLNALREAKRNARKRATRAGAPEVEIKAIQTHYEACTVLRHLGIAVELDHLHPLSKGGAERLENIQIKMRAANQAKSNSMDEALARFEYWHGGRLMNRIEHTGVRAS